MNAKSQHVIVQQELTPRKRPAYDPNNLDPLDEEGRKHDPDDGIDYDEIIASTQDDFLAGNFKEFNPEHYPTREAMIKAIKAYHDEFWPIPKAP